MKAVIQRCSKAKVFSEGELSGEISNGLVILLGVNATDTEAECDLLSRKCADLRIFCDENDKMNLSALDVDGEIMVVSNFTLCADTKKGNRPSFINAMEPQRANELYLRFCKKLTEYGVKKVATGVFRTEMTVSLDNDGPITLVLDTDIWVKK